MLVETLVRRGDRVTAWGGPTREGGIELTDGAAVRQALERTRPDAVIHAAALSAMADCAREPRRARRVNVDATANVARACVDVGARLVHVSTDLVFDGERAPYREGDQAFPTSVYGATKLEAETAAREAASDTSDPERGVAVVRVSLLFGPTRNARRGFFDQQLDALRTGAEMRLFTDEWRTPLSLRSAAEALVAIAGSSFEGTLHLAGPERLSRFEMGHALAEALGASSPNLVPTSRRDVPGEPRARDVSLDISRFRTSFPAIELLPFREECRRFAGAMSG